MTSLESGVSEGTSAQYLAIALAQRHGHALSAWEPYGAASLKSRCTSCGAEVRIAFSTARGRYRDPEGPAVDPARGTCSYQAARHPQRKRGDSEERMMAKKPMSTPGAPAAGMRLSANGRETMGRSATMLSGVDDASAQDVYAAGVRPRGGSKGDDIDMGVNAHRARTATNASAQFRVSVSHRAPQPETYPGTTASGKILPPVMGQHRPFVAGTESGD